MSKRFGHIFEAVTSLENCEQAVLDALANKKKTRYLTYIRKHYKEYGLKIRNLLLNGWIPQTPRHKTINEGTNKKERGLTIPTLIDHFIHTAVARVLKKYLQPKFYYYASGSIPVKGQVFSKNALVKMLKKNPKYAAECDVKKFYDNVCADTVMKELSRIFKDKKFLELNRKILTQMGGHLAIGFTLSHWYAHMILMRVDHEVKEKCPEIGLVRSMDNFILLHDSKEELHKAIRIISNKLNEYGLRLKEDWQVFQIEKRPVKFLSYRHQKGKTILKKPLMYRISRRAKHLKPCARHARIMMSYLGILKHCNSHKFIIDNIYPYMSINESKRLISDADKKCILRSTTRESYSYC